MIPTYRYPGSRYTSRVRTPSPAWYLVSLTLLLTACAPKASGPAAFEGPDSATRLEALSNAARSGDRSSIPHLVALLDDDDPAVRLLAGATLEKLTGLTMGYDATAPRHQRLAAIERWKTWMAEESAAGRGAVNDGARENTREGIRGQGLGGTR